MISTNSIMVASPIALARQEKETPLVNRTADFIQTLVAMSTGSTPLTPENLVKEVPAGVTADSEHNLVQDQAITMIADGVNNAFTQIRQYLRPLDSKIRTNMDGIYTPTSAITAVHNNLYVRYIELDHMFFDSVMFPTKTPDPVFNYQGFTTSELAKHAGCFPVLDETGISKLLETNSDEMHDLLDIGLAMDIYNSLFVHGHWDHWFEVKEGTLNLTPKYMDVSRLMHLYVIASRLFVEDDVLPGVERMTLPEYRTYINKILNIATYTLQHIRNHYRTLAGLKLPILKVNMADRAYEFNTVSGDITVGLTDTAIAELEASNVSLSEALIGYAKTCFDRKDKNIPSLMGNLKEYIEVYRAYVQSVQNAIVQESESRVKHIVEEAVNEFQKTHTEFSDKIENMGTDLAYRRLYSAIETSANQWYASYRQRVIQANVPLEEFLSTPFIAIAVARTLGLELAADVLEKSVVTSDMTLEQQRGKLAEAVTGCITQLCFGKYL
ncbi:virion structural protein [Vibrio phage USC-1]|uniref:Uncharacterized protein n=2 Tax=Aphroditevirus USC1 TaxID=2846605 RepID=A0A514A2U3_9CAUD|nr:virion structural protein [Vibrio phage USC-1]QCW23144.1 hypothetical protein [Vibrio phage 5 TSL-2019]QDH47583.1 hypothetical protein [Vibrio phage USC-1]